MAQPRLKQFRKSSTNSRPAKRIDPADYARTGDEHSHQVALFMWAAEQIASGRFPELAMMFAIPNGGERNIAVAARLKAEGVKAGVPDIFLPVPRHGVAGLFLELKRPKAEGKRQGSAQDNQSEWIGKLQAQGFGAAVVYGYEAARDMLIQYLSNFPVEGA